MHPLPGFPRRGVGPQLVEPGVLAGGIGQVLARQIASEVPAIGGDGVGVAHLEAESTPVEVRASKNSSSSRYVKHYRSPSQQRGGHLHCHLVGADSQRPEGLGVRDHLADDDAAPRSVSARVGHVLPSAQSLANHPDDGQLHLGGLPFNER